MRGKTGLQIDSSEGAELGLEAVDLPRGKVEHALVIGVVHEVLNGFERKRMRN
jgi:hypothetical protein